MDEKILEILNQKVEEQVELNIEALVRGGSQDYASYRELCGVIRGLQTAQREIADLVRKLKESDDD
jgi:tRNA(Ser,Leu) C12 N-acetylase TAN1